ncbi:hypothetical protein BH10ACI4_BH10ACI4_23900 [soil metagenome]
MTIVQPQALRAPLLGCGYRPELLREDFEFGLGQSAPFVAFAQSPTDSRSACVAVTSADLDPRSAVDACKPLGAPIVFVCSGSSLQWWKQGTQAPEFLESIAQTEIQQFFNKRKDDFSPEAIYRAKTWGRFKTEYQLSFVDLGLMPLVEAQVGRSLETLIERNVSALKEDLGLAEVSVETGHWLLQTIFWLLSGKILHDKQVKGFGDLDLTNVAEVFQRLAAHYGTASLRVQTKEQRAGLQNAANTISRFSSLALTTTESLAYVYENALISKETRSTLGTHSTPSFLVDYVVGNLSDWIAEIPVEDRSVFEPACGHAAFLVSAMRLLTELLPPELATPVKRGPYLRKRLHGSDIDSFALELARLSLTLTDIPNPNGWDLKAGDMFVGDSLVEQAKKSTVLLANPPFDNFSTEDQASYLRKGSKLDFMNKSAEMLWRTLPNLREGAVFGLVLPQSFLHNRNARGAREMLLSKFELREICLFPDNVFSFSAVESVVLLGRRKSKPSPDTVRFRRIRERGLEMFRSCYAASSTTAVPQVRFRSDANLALRVPDFIEVWDVLKDSPTLGDIADAGQGLIFHGVDLPEGSVTYAQEASSKLVPGFVHFDAGLQLHELPTVSWVNLDPSVIRRPVSGTVTGVSQVLLNYAPSSRGPWRLKALLDSAGHAVSSNFIAVRPKLKSHSVLALWALLNSPLANAYVFAHLGKRHNVVGEVRKMPMPAANSFDALENAAARFLDAASSGGTDLSSLLLDMDAEVLRLYNLPPQLERLVLDAFAGWQRVGVSFAQTCYFPEGFSANVSLSDFRMIERSWERTNRERGLLIDRGIAGKLTPIESARLGVLQDYADFHVHQVAPRPLRELEDLEDRLLSRRLGEGGER